MFTGIKTLEARWVFDVTETLRECAGVESVTMEGSSRSFWSSWSSRARCPRYQADSSSRDRAYSKSSPLMLAGSMQWTLAMECVAVCHHVTRRGCLLLVVRERKNQILWIIVGKTDLMEGRIDSANRFRGSISRSAGAADLGRFFVKSRSRDIIRRRGFVAAMIHR